MPSNINKLGSNDFKPEANDIGGNDSNTFGKAGNGPLKKRIEQRRKGRKVKKNPKDS